MVVFPTPPLPEPTAIMLLTPGSGNGPCCGGAPCVCPWAMCEVHYTGDQRGSPSSPPSRDIPVIGFCWESSSRSYDTLAALVATDERPIARCMNDGVTTDDGDVDDDARCRRSQDPPLTRYALSAVPAPACAVRGGGLRLHSGVFLPAFP